MENAYEELNSNHKCETTFESSSIYWSLKEDTDLHNDGGNTGDMSDRDSAQDRVLNNPIYASDGDNMSNHEPAPDRLLNNPI